MPTSTKITMLALFAASLAVAPDARAGVWHSSIIVGGGTALCQSATPAYEGLIRKRPLALQNEGTSKAFVTCSLVADGNADPRSISRAVIVLINNGNVAAPVSCTLVTRFGSLPVKYMPKSASIPAQGRSTMVWDGTVGNEIAAFASFSCSLPPGVGIEQLNATQRIFSS